MRLVIKLLASVAVLLTITGAAVWYFVLRGNAAPPATIDRTSTVSGHPLAGTFVLVPGDPRSFVGYRVQEKFVGGVVETTATGRTHGVTAKLTINRTTVTDISADADLTTLRSDRSERDSSIKTTGLESNRFPHARFVLAEPVHFTRPPKLGETVSTTATGDFTLHDITQRVHVRIQGRWDGKDIQVVGHLPITFADYAIQAPSIGGFVSVHDHGEMEFQLFLKPETTPAGQH